MQPQMEVFLSKENLLISYHQQATQQYGTASLTIKLVIVVYTDITRNQPKQRSIPGFPVQKLLSKKLLKEENYWPLNLELACSLMIPFNIYTSILKLLTIAPVTRLKK